MSASSQYVRIRQYASIVECDFEARNHFFINPTFYYLNSILSKLSAIYSEKGVPIFFAPFKAHLETNLEFNFSSVADELSENPSGWEVCL